MEVHPSGELEAPQKHSHRPLIRPGNHRLEALGQDRNSIDGGSGHPQPEQDQGRKLLFEVDEEMVKFTSPFKKMMGEKSILVFFVFMVVEGGPHSDIAGHNLILLLLWLLLLWLLLQVPLPFGLLRFNWEHIPFLLLRWRFLDFPLCSLLFLNHFGDPFSVFDYFFGAPGG